MIAELPSPPELDPDPEDEAKAESKNLLPFFLVGIGASAGGIQAYIDLFDNLPADTGMAFVVVPHLAPDQPSRLRDILALHTSMKVLELDGPTRPEPNFVYVLPPNSFVNISGGVLTLETRPPQVRIPMPINQFFRSLAGDQKSRAVGVVLSGMDSDGADGLKTIKGEGGISIVQDPQSARFPSMPERSIAADHVDMILTPARIGTELARLGRQFQSQAIHNAEHADLKEERENGLPKIFASLLAVSGLDFREYKPGTIMRRLTRRMILKKIDDLRDYATFVEEHNEEARTLQEDLLINVTRFFRDTEVFDALRNTVIPQLFANRGADANIRVWVAGCSTGEEVYSIAICLLDYLDSHSAKSHATIQIFGTDASESSIKFARAGFYLASIVNDIAPERLERFFTREDKGYQVVKRVRDLCVFARQNLCTDPPYSQLDLVSCRNVLIYLEGARQERILQTLHYSLRPNGFLMLGKAETTRQVSDLFTAVHRKARLYKKIPGGERSRFELWRPIPTLASQAPAVIPADGARKGWNESDLQRAVDRVLLTHFDVPVVVVDEHLNVVFTRGPVKPFMEIASGASSLHLMRMLRSGIAGPIRDATARAIKEDIPVQLEAGLMEGELGREIAIEVIPIQNSVLSPRCYVILFLNRKAIVAPIGSWQSALPASQETNDASELVAQLHADLTATKRYMQSIIEDRDAKNQELVSTSEEILSQNEELQSTNEELETTKEEIQSANEELQTVNDELQQRNSAVTQAGNDLTNLLASVNLPVVMLNTEMQIRQFTPAAQKMMSVRASDVGRPIREIRLHLNFDDLEPVVAEVLETLTTKEVEVQDKDGRWHILRVRPYRTVENKIEGTVLLLIDIDESRRIQRQLREARDFSAAIFEGVRIPLVVLNHDLRIRTVNKAFRTLVALLPDLEGRFFPDFAGTEWDIGDAAERLNALWTQDSGAETVLEHVQGGTGGRSVCIRATAMTSDGERVLLLVVEDVTNRKQAENVLTGERDSLKSQVRSSAHQLTRTQDELHALAGKLFTSQEEERRRIARELHDDLAQKLAAIDLTLEKFAREVPGDGIRQRLDSLRRQTAVVTEDARQISHRLHPAILDDLGLSIALRSLTEEFGAREEMLASFEAGDVPEVIPHEVSASLYRVAQEALRNVAKHAGKTHVKVSLWGTESGIRLEVLDFGEGFDLAEGMGGLGVISMTERARLVGGVVSFQSTLGRGTHVSMDVPLKRQENSHGGEAPPAEKI